MTMASAGQGGGVEAVFGEGDEACGDRALRAEEGGGQRGHPDAESGAAFGLGPHEGAAEAEAGDLGEDAEGEAGEEAEDERRLKGRQRLEAEGFEHGVSARRAPRYGGRGCAGIKGRRAGAPGQRPRMRGSSASRRPSPM